MNWDKAKNLTLLFLLVVNLFLGGLIYNAGRKYTLTSAQEDAITAYLARNGVSLYTTIPQQFKPMAAMRIQPSAYDASELAPAFFDGTENVTPEYNGARATYTRAAETLTVEGDSFVYENTANRPGFVLTRANAADVCNKFLAKHENLFDKYVLDRVEETGNGYTVSYCGKFRNRLLISNTMVFSVTADGIRRITGTYNKPLALSGEAREIISPDEALYKFVKHMNYVYGDQEILLDSMDIVYYLSETPTDSSIPLSAAPYYRFYVFSGEALVLINAYTGVVYGSVY